MSNPRILVACDGSEASAAAVRAAGRLLPAADALVVTVAEQLGGFDGAAARVALPDEVIRAGVRRLRESALEAAGEHARECAAAARALALDATPRAVEADGAVLPALLEVAREAQAELIFCGTRGHKRVARALLGSVSNGLLHDAELPLLIVPADAPDDDGAVVIGHDGSDDADRAVELCARLLARRDVTIVHAWHSAVSSTRTGRALAALPLQDLREIVAAFDEDARERAGEALERGPRVPTSAACARRRTASSPTTRPPRCCCQQPQTAARRRSRSPGAAAER